MTLRIDWPPEIVRQVKHEADRLGLSIDDYLLQVLHGERSAMPSALAAISQESARQSAVARILELRRRHELGPDITIREMIEEGRRL